MPTYETLKKQLIEHPVSDNFWYNIIEKYEHFKAQRYANLITDLVCKLAFAVI